MKEKIIFEWLDDDTIIAINEQGTEIERILISEQNRLKNCRIEQKYENGKAIYYMPGTYELSVADKDELIKSVSAYFEKHDIKDYDAHDLWFEVACDHLCFYGFGE